MPRRHDAHNWAQTKTFCCFWGFYFLNGWFGPSACLAWPMLIRCGCVASGRVGWRYIGVVLLKMRIAGMITIIIIINRIYTIRRPVVQFIQ